jgi:uncharacterized delta-60 repeat protein
MGILAIAILGFAPAVQAASGDLDPSFGGDGLVTTGFSGVSDYAQDLVLQPDGKIIAAGPGGTDFALARYNADGSLDTSFGGDGKVTTDFGGSDFAAALALQPDGRIIAAGTGNGTDFALARYNADGSLDSGFGGGDGVVTSDLGSSDAIWAITLRSDGRIVAAGENNGNFALARYNADGSLDSDFGEGDGIALNDLGGYDVVVGLTRQLDSKILAAGIGGGTDDFVVARYNADGSLDTGFGGGDGLAVENLGGYDHAADLAVQPNGKIIAVGGGGSEKATFVIARYLADGSLDTGFGGDGIVTTDLGAFGSHAYAVASESDGQFLVAGAGEDDFVLGHYNVDGSLDTDFGGDGAVVTDYFGDTDYGSALVVQPDGRIIVGGGARNFGSFNDDSFALARYLGDDSAPPDEELPTGEELPPPALPSAAGNGFIAAPTPSGQAGRMKCRKGFRKRKIRGKPRCVKVKRAPHRRRAGRG